MIELDEMFETMQDVAERLHDLGLAYMVTGSFAMSVYAKARATMGIDIVLELGGADASRFEERFAGDYYIQSPDIIRANERQSMFNIINNSTLIKVDCIIRKNDSFEIEKFARRRRSKISGVDFWVISKEDLILSKLKWARESHSERQFEDVRNLLETGTDDSFLEDQLLRMDLGDAWTAFEEWKTRVEK
jgi:hypothetical protein